MPHPQHPQCSYGYNEVLNRDTSFVGVSSLDIKRRTLTKEKGIAKALNQHFVTVGTKLAEKLEAKNNDDTLIKINAQTKKLTLKLTDNTYVLNANSKLENGKAPGPDKISTFWGFYLETIDNDIQLILGNWCFPGHLEINECHSHF